MQLPSALKTAIENLSQSSSRHHLVEAREELTKRYREPTKLQFMTNEDHRLAYISARLPATYASLISAFQAIQAIASFPIKSMLDLGAGPGTGMWAACEAFPEIETFTLLEKDQALAKMGKSLAECSEHQAIRSALWQEADLEKITELPKADLVMLSYSIGELSSSCQIKLLEMSWQAANQLLLIAEPGTPVGFERIRMIRQALIEWQAHLIAPCPHREKCPMSNGDWCHFSARVERSALHRQIKGGALSYEDEKFSYVAAAKSLHPLPEARILRQPAHHSGHIKFKLCTANGLQDYTASKKMGEQYKKARKLEWGDAIVL